jgi:flotillin
MPGSQPIHPFSSASSPQQVRQLQTELQIAQANSDAPPAQDGSWLGTAILIGVPIVGVVAVGAVSTWFLKSFLCICKPNEIVVLAGRKHKTSQGREVGYRVLTGGRSLRIPVLETVQRMDATTIPIRIEVRKAYAKGGTPLNIHAIANVKISTDQALVGNAIERFLGCKREELARVAQETLEGYLRGIVATLTPEEINEDRLRFAEQVAGDVSQDLVQLGLQLDTLKLQSVSDDMDYLRSLGRKQIALILRDAEIAESNALTEAEQVEAQCEEYASVAQTQNQTIVLERENELRKLKAKLEQTAKSEEEITIAAAKEKKAKAEQILQALRADYERLRLSVDEVLPAEAQRQAAEYQARGQAASVEENARAAAIVNELLSDVWKDSGKQAAELFVLQQLDLILAEAGQIPKRIHLNQVNVIDNGNGHALASLMNVYPQIISEYLRSVEQILGVKIAQ